MIQEIQALLDRYVAWLRDKTTLREVGDWVEVSTPYLDRHNDYLLIYAKRTNGDYILTDDGFVLGDLEQSGCKLDSPKRQSLLKMTLNGFGIQLNQGRLEVRASADDFAHKKHNLVQAMLAVNDMFYLAESMVTNLFLEDVAAWLDVLEIRYTPKVKFTGKTGYDHVFDFVIPKSRARPERILRAINRPSRDAAMALAFSWVDTREVRPPYSRAYAVLNDAGSEVRSEVAEALRRYDLRPVLWSKRDEVREELAA